MSNFCAQCPTGRLKIASEQKMTGLEVGMTQCLLSTLICKPFNLHTSVSTVKQNFILM